MCWIPNENWETADKVPAEFEVSNEVIMEYHTGWVDYDSIG